MAKFSALISLSLVLLAGVALADPEKSVYLNFNGFEFVGGAQLKLGQELKKQFPSVDLSRLRVRKVVLEAKGRDASSSTALESHGLTSALTAIGGSPEDYQNPAPWSYFRVPLNNPDASGYGEWVVRISGTAKLAGIHVVGTGFESASLVDLGTYRTYKDEKEIYVPVRLGRVKAIIIRGTATETTITEALAEIGQGEHIELRQLVYPWIKAGEERKEILPAGPQGIYVDHIDLKAKAWISSQSSEFKVFAELVQ